MSSGLVSVSDPGIPDPSKQISLINNTRAPRRNVYDGEFLVFWDEYPRKVAKGAAARAWKRQAPPIVDVLQALKWQRRQDQWQRDGGQYVPHPATYLNDRRWEDEEPQATPIRSAREQATVAGLSAWLRKQGGAK